MKEDKFSHLTKEEINSLVEDYYNKIKISDLIIKYNLKLKANEFTRNLPPETTNSTCRFCGVNLIKPRISRDYISWKKSQEFCPNCGHEENILCSCINCMKLENDRKDKERREKQEFLEEYFSSKKEENDFNNLSFTDRVYLGSILREGISEDYNYVRSLETFINPVAPTDNFRSEIIKGLIGKEIITIHESTKPEHIMITDYKSGAFEYYTYKVNWSLNVNSASLNKVPLIDSIINPNEINDTEVEEAFLLWKKIALNECIQYFDYSVNNILGIDYTIGEKTIGVLTELLNEYSVSQIYGIIYKATNSALRFQVEKGCSRKQAANTIIGNAQSYAERAKINNWQLQRYNRIKECPESAVSKFFFERIIKIGYLGFNETPNISLIKYN